MKLLFDQNLSFRLCEAVADTFPGSIHVRHVGMDSVDDRTIWEFAERNGYAIVSQDSDFADIAILLGWPPKVIWIRTGNQSLASLTALLRNHADIIAAFAGDEAACLEIY
jgi:predicted nuclease of predicted toxin-antitoxin system